MTVSAIVIVVTMVAVIAISAVVIKVLVWAAAIIDALVGEVMVMESNAFVNLSIDASAGVTRGVLAEISVAVRPDVSAKAFAVAMTASDPSR